MATYSESALLPEGLHDDLPQEAEAESCVLQALLANFASYGYERVSPPLIEFEDSLLAGPGATQSRQMFRLMDPLSQRMMGVRTDITFQVARIATTRLASVERPLRLCYAGDVLRVKGGQIRTERQFGQAGVEIIGSSSIESDVEVLLLASDALGALGVRNLSIDLTLPNLVPAICRGLGLDREAATVARDALNNKDIGELKAIEGATGQLLRGLLAAAGPANEALRDLDRLDLPTEARVLCDELSVLVKRVQQMAPDLTLTIDPGEYEGFEYKTGIGFSLFAKGVRGELGRGGRYMVARPGAGKQTDETAVGFSVYMDSVMRAVPSAQKMSRVFIPAGTEISLVKKLQAEGWRTVRGLEPVLDLVSEARRHNCSHLLENEQVSAIG